MTSPGWFLHTADRRFGPLTEDEMRAYFRAGMVKANDVVHAPGREAPLSATEAAGELGMPAPPPLPVAPTPYEPPRKPVAHSVSLVAAEPIATSVQATTDASATPAHAPSSNAPLVPPPPTTGFKVTERGPDSRWPIVLWIAVLFGAHLVLAPLLFPARAAAMSGFALLSFVVCALVAAVLFTGFSLLAKAMRVRPPRIHFALAALTLAYLGAGARHVMVEGIFEPRVARIDVREGLMEWERRAAALHAGQDWPALLAHANLRLREHADNHVALSWRGIAYRGLQRYTEASRDFERVTVLVPDRPRGWAMLGDARYKNRDFERAIEAYRRAIELDPADAESWNSLGSAHDYARRPDEAILAFERAVAIDPKLAVAWSNLALMYANQGRNAEADEARAKALALGR